MATTNVAWKNPFKFISTRPDWKDLWQKCQSYNTSIDKYDVKQIRISVFFWLAMKEWEEGKEALLTRTSFIRMLKQQELTLSMPSKEYTWYKSYLPPSNIPDELYLTALLTLTVDIFRRTFEDEYITPKMVRELTNTEDSVRKKIQNRNRILSEFNKYVSIDLERPVIPVNSKEHLSEIIFIAILAEESTIPSFEYIKEESTNEIPF